MYPAGDSDDTADELPAEMTMLFWTIHVLASDSEPYTFEQKYAEAQKEGLIPHDGDFGNTYLFY